MMEEDISRLVRLLRIPSEVITRAPGAEVAPDPQPGEHIVGRHTVDTRGPVVPDQ
jgi:NH3-dependent NAD+ synthetase